LKDFKEIKSLNLSRSLEELLDKYSTMLREELGRFKVPLSS